MKALAILGVLLAGFLLGLLFMGAFHDCEKALRERAAKEATK